MNFIELIKQGLQKLACLHDYKEIKSLGIYENYNDKLPVKYTLLYQCKKCGKFKKITMQ